MNLMEMKSATELRTLLINAGVWAYADDFRFAADNDLVAYVGYSDRVHRYAIPIKEDGGYAIRTMMVWLGPEGRMVGEMEPDVLAVVETPIEAINFIIRARRRS